MQLTTGGTGKPEEIVELLYPGMSALSLYRCMVMVTPCPPWLEGFLSGVLREASHDCHPRMVPRAARLAHHQSSAQRCQGSAFARQAGPALAACHARRF